MGVNSLHRSGTLSTRGLNGRSFGPLKRVTTDSHKCHLDVGEASVGENILDDGCSSNSSLVEERTGIHTDAYNKRAERLGLPSIGIGEGIDGRPYYANGFKLVADARADRNSSRLNSVTVNWARLTEDTPAQRSLTYGPVRARLVDTGSTRTIEVAIGV